MLIVDFLLDCDAWEVAKRNFFLNLKAYAGIIQTYLMPIICIIVSLGFWFVIIIVIVPVATVLIVKVMCWKLSVTCRGCSSAIRAKYDVVALVRLADVI